MKTLKKLYEFNVVGLMDYEKEILNKAFKKAKFLKDILKEGKLEKQAIESIAILTGLRESFIKEHLDEIKKL